ncbi:hypothetical protein HZS_5259 [Henneguya salminicola]|nr:hypothetical protein HZS_5259 [Henneguya salminicola]
MDGCIFCEIYEQLKHTNPEKILKHDEDIFIISDKYPSAQNHILVIPKNHIENIDSIVENNVEIIYKMESVVKNYFEEKQISMESARK